MRPLEPAAWQRGALVGCGVVMLFVLGIVAPQLADREDRDEVDTAEQDPVGDRPELDLSFTGPDGGSTSTSLAGNGSDGAPTGPTAPGTSTTAAGSPGTTAPGPRGTTTLPTAAPPTTVPAPAPPTTVKPVTTTTLPGATTTTVVGKEPARPLRIMVAGDSTAGVWGDGLQQWGRSEAHRMDVAIAGGPGCTIHQDGTAVLRPGWSAAPCPGLIDVIISATKAQQVDALLLVIGSIQLADWVGGTNLVPTGLGAPAYDAAYRNAFDQVLRRLGTELSVPILVATIPTPRWVNPGAPGTGEISVNDDARARRLNEINRSVVAGHQRARMVALAEAVDVAGGAVDPALHPDGLHIEPALVPGVVDRGLGAEMRSAYVSVISAQPGLRRPGSTIWWR